MPRTTEYPVATPVDTDTVVGNASAATSLFTVTGLKTAMALANVENTALSTWAGTANITTLGTIVDGVWNGDPLDGAFITDLAITAAKLADAAVEAAKIAAGAVGTTHLADQAVTLAKLQNIAQDTLIGRSAIGTGVPEEITIGEGLDLTSGVLSAVGGGSGGSGTFSLGSGSAAELAANVVGGGWTASGTGASVDGLGLEFVSANNLAACAVTASGLQDNTSYDVVYTVENYTGGSFRLQLYGDTLNQVGAGATHSGNGTFTETILVDPGTGSLTNTIRIQATGSSGTNSFRVTAVSVRETGGGGYPVRSTTTKLKEMEVSVIDFGADPTGASDDTAAFNAAISYGVRRIKVPTGEYNVDHLVINYNIEIVGEGRNNTIINVTGNGDIHGIEVRGLSSLGSGNLIRLSQFKLVYTGSGQTAAGSTPGNNNWSGIYITRKVLMDEVDVREFTNDGLYYAPNDADEGTGAGGTIDQAVFFSRMDNVWSKYNGRDGIRVRRGANANSFINCQFDHNGHHGFHHFTDGFATYGNTIRDGQCSYNHDHGYYFENGTNIVTSGLYAELNGYSGGTGYAVSGMKDFYVGDSCSRSWIGIGVLYNSDTSLVRLPGDSSWGNTSGLNSNIIQVWEGGRRGHGTT